LSNNRDPREITIMVDKKIRKKKISMILSRSSKEERRAPEGLEAGARGEEEDVKRQGRMMTAVNRGKIKIIIEIETAKSSKVLLLHRKIDLKIHGSSTIMLIVMTRLMLQVDFGVEAGEAAVLQGKKDSEGPMM
jgi:hypothetical protein